MYEVKKNRIVVYTALFGGYDNLIELTIDDADVDFVCFTENPELKSNSWNIVYVDKPFDDPVLCNRYYKMHPHLFFKDYDRSVYIDGNVRILNSMYDLVQFNLAYDIIFAKHEHRNCLYDEAQVCISKKNTPEKLVDKQMSFYRNDGFPKDFGLGEMNIIIRKHHSNEIIELMDQWWEQFMLWAKRDQLSFFYLIWKNNINFNYLHVNPREKNDYFFIELHSNASKIKKIKRSLKRIIYTKL
ncbi:DUF616 domain-containing protein [Vibrio cincinnatiensis]|uniref:glycosyltransferase domain-containing protein n=1 Tax=Vibrio cincinnatiensis TaxID=675 RepID=UPI001EDF2641|nr:glycosyltransferase domain-containing protein [Vibrio cincinnatiensis]MCG3760577.1 DUF616 domain-containing protein [Vibrio cincinnatiensis]MCG3763046.1 DUF616 domain-containing protein [Vibrio cincinnatiensis]